METIDLTPEEPEENEFKVHWQNATEIQQGCVIMAFCAACKPDDSALIERLFDLGNPFVIFGDKLSYCRISKESLQVMRIIFSNYLK